VGVTVGSLRPMTAADVAAVADLERECFTDPWPPASFFEELGREDRQYLVVEADRRVTAYGGLMLVDGDAHIMTIAVAPDRRRMGEGTLLLLGLVDAALEGSASSLTLEVRVSNEAAAALYRKFGFVSVGVRPSYYRDEDALIMWVVDATGDEYRERLDRIREELA
jgi:[ribosomal protein S18]-alanine N-acetyltransferase